MGVKGEKGLRGVKGVMEEKGLKGVMEEKGLKGLKGFIGLKKRRGNGIRKIREMQKDKDKSSSFLKFKFSQYYSNL